MCVWGGGGGGECVCVLEMGLVGVRACMCV